MFHGQVLLEPARLSILSLRLNVDEKVLCLVNDFCVSQISLIWQSGFKKSVSLKKLKVSRCACFDSAVLQRKCVCRSCFAILFPIVLNLVVEIFKLIKSKSATEL